MATVDIETARAWVRTVAETVGDHVDELTNLDSAIGDGDHGQNMRRGFSAVTDRLATASPDSVGDVLTLTGRTLISSVGGASGPLYGSAFRAAGKRLTGETAEAGELAEALRDGLDAVRKLGGTQLGDKTMVDAYAPAVDAFADILRDGGGLTDAARAAATSADTGARDTTPMTARKGRASYLGERSAGHQDPGATSTALIFQALASVLSES